MRRSHAALLLAAVSSLAFSCIVWIMSKDVSEELEKVIVRDQEVALLSSALIDVEDAATALNVPGNEVFRSRSPSQERAALETSYSAFETSVQRLEQLKSHSGIELPEFKDMVDRISAGGKKIHSESLEEFRIYKKGNLSKASEMMAQMDRSFAELRQETIALRRRFIEMRNKNLADLHSFSRQRTRSSTSAASMQFLLSILFLITGLWTLLSNKEDTLLIDFYRYALDSVAMVAITDKNGRIVHANQKFLLSSGYKSEEIIGQHHHTLNSGYHSKEFFNHLWETIRTGAVWNGTVRNRRQDGSHYWVDSTIVPRKQSGDIQDYFAVQYDVTAKKKLAEELEKSRERYALALEAISVGVWEVMSPIAVSCSGRFCELIGLGPNDRALESRGLLRRVPAPQRRSVISAIRNCVKGGTMDIELSIKVRSGQRWFRATAKASRTEDGSSFRIIGSLQDIEETKALQSRLEAARQLAEDAARTKSEFLANMSHEIRTPLSGLIGTLALLRDQEMSPKAGELVAIAEDCGGQLRNLIGDVLDFSKVEAGKIVLEKIPISLPLLIEQVARLHKSAAKEKNIELRVSCNYSKNLVQGDELRLKQVLGNLLANAIKFTSTGSVEIRAHIRSTTERSVEALFEVIDTGPGIPDAVQSKLFRSFSQVDASTTRIFGGTGLGLAICKGLCEAMGGSIGLSSQEGVGSRFFFRIPFEVETGSSIREPNTTGASSVRFGGRRVLVVDDNPTNRLVAKGFLEKLGVEVVLASSGKEALEAFSQTVLDLALVDSQMPEMDGVQLVSYLRNAKHLDRCHIAAFTASNTTAERDRWRKVGVTHFLGKPFTISDLTKVLADALGSQTQEDAREKKPRIRNLSGALRLYFDGDMNLFAEGVARLERTFSEKFPLLRQACSEKNLQSIHFLGHFLKGSCSSFGDPELKDLLSRLENFQENSGPEAIKMLSAAERLAEELISDLRHFIQERSAA